MMSIKYSQSFVIGILALVTWSASAFADIKDDLAQAQQALDREDLPEAVKFYKKAAEQNSLQAQFMLGELQHSQQEFGESCGWYMTAAYQGDAASAYGLGQLYINGEGVDKSFEKGVYWIKLAAGKNYQIAQVALATAYKQGDWGLPVDLELSKSWESKAAVLRELDKRQFDKEFSASRAAVRAEREAQAKEAAEKRDAAAAKRVDDSDK
jgi:TPR repeat protein